MEISNKPRDIDVLRMCTEIKLLVCLRNMLYISEEKYGERDYSECYAIADRLEST